MPTLIDALLVELKLDASQFDEGQKRAVQEFDKTRRQMADQSKKLGESVESATKKVTNFGLAAAELFGLFTTASGAKQFIEQTTAANAALGRLGQNLATSPQAIRAWGQAAESLGGSAEATSASFQKLGDAIENYKINGQQLPRAFYQLEAASGKQIDLNHGLEKSFSDAAKALNALYSVDPQKADFLGRQLGLDPDTVNLMERFGDKLGEIVEARKRLAPSADDIEKSQELQAAWAGLAQSADAFGRSIVSDVSPAITAAANATAKLVQAAQGEHDRQEKLMQSPEGLSEAQRERDANTKAAHDWIYNHLGIDLDGGRGGGSGASAKDRLDMRFGDDFEARRGRAFSGLGEGHDVSVRGSPVSQSNPLPVVLAGVPGSGSTGGFWSSLGQSIQNFVGSVGNGLSSAAHAATAGGGSTHSANTGDAMSFAMDQLRREGVPEGNLRAAASLLVGQAQMESGLNPDAVHDGGTGYGIYGAHLGRRDKMLAWLSANGYAKNSLEGQMRYMAHEAMNDPNYGPTKGALMGATEGGLAGDSATVTKNFEAPSVANDRSGATIGAFRAGPTTSDDSGYFVIGDSTGRRLMMANGWGGNAWDGAQPEDIRAKVQSMQWKDIAGKKIVIAAGSNNPAKLGEVSKMIQWLTRLGAKPGDITVLGMGSRPDLAAHNQELKGLADQAGVHFQPMGATGDGVHEDDARGLGGQIRNGYGAPTSAISSRNKWALDWSRASVAGRNAVIGAHGATTTTNSTSHEMNVGNVTIVTQANDAHGIAKEFSSALEAQQLAAQGNYGTA